MIFRGPERPGPSRRTFCAGLGAGLLLPACRSVEPAGDTREWARRIAALEPDASTRIGAQVIDLATGRGFGWRAEERFAMCSAFKLSLAAMVLAEVYAGRVYPDERISYTEANLLSASPVTRANIGKGMTVIELAKAAQVASDNAAANLLMDRFGGPQALTAFWRRLGDGLSRLDRTEPQLNSVLPGDPRDTTTPAAMAGTLRALFTGAGLAPEPRERLESWMAATRTGVRRIRAGLPEGWTCGDKTGTAVYDDRPSHIVDIALVTAPFGRRIAIAGFVTTTVPQTGVDPDREALLAKVGGIAVDWVEATFKQ